jgi:hypothetical protein
MDPGPARWYKGPSQGQAIRGATMGARTRTVVAVLAALLGLGGIAAVATPAGAATVPGAPTGVVARVGQTGWAEVDWGRPASDGGSPIRYWVIRPFPGGRDDATANVADYGDHLSAQTLVDYGVTYRFQVAAVNDVGQGPFSTAAAPVTPVPLVTISAPAPVTEGASGTRPMTFTVKLDFRSALPVTMRYATQKAGAGRDFVATEGTLTFAPGETAETVSVPIIGDALYEQNEKVTLRLSHATNGQFGAWTASGTVTNDDPMPSLRLGDATKVEGAAGQRTNAKLTLALSAPSGAVSTVHWSTHDVTATAGGGDYVASSGTAMIGAGRTTVDLPIPVLGDARDEPDEAVLVTIDSPVNATIADGWAILTIRDDD